MGLFCVASFFRDLYVHVRETRVVDVGDTSHNLAWIDSVLASSNIERFCDCCGRIFSPTPSHRTSNTGQRVKGIVPIAITSIAYPFPTFLLVGILATCFLSGDYRADCCIGDCAVPGRSLIAATGHSGICLPCGYFLNINMDKNIESGATSVTSSKRIGCSSRNRHC